MAFLLGMSECVKGVKFEITSNTVSIGRSNDNDLVVEHETISSKHCFIDKNGDTYKVRDNDSTNGTMVNSSVVSEAELKPKDLIQFGAVEFVFDGEELQASPEPEPEPQSEPAPSSATEIIADDTNAPVGPPQSFSSVSPFGTRKKQNRNFWIVALIAIGVLALAGVGFLVVKLLF